MPSKLKHIQNKEKPIITKTDGVIWGIVVILPFGWIILWVIINQRRKEVEQGLRNKESAITSIHNYMIGLAMAGIIMMIIYPSGIINIIAILVLIVSAIRNTSRIKNFGVMTIDNEPEIVDTKETVHHSDPVSPEDIDYDL